MSQIMAICPRCGAVVQAKKANEAPLCANCDVPMAKTVHAPELWKRMSGADRKNIIKEVMEQADASPDAAAAMVAYLAKIAENTRGIKNWIIFIGLSIIIPFLISVFSLFL